MDAIKNVPTGKPRERKPKDHSEQKATKCDPIRSSTRIKLKKSLAESKDSLVEPKVKYVPTGKPRGRPPMDPSERKTQKYVRTGKPTGRRLMDPSERKPKYVPTGKPKGRRHLTPSEREAKKYVPTGKPRGRRPMTPSEREAKKYVPTGKPFGRQRKLTSVPKPNPILDVGTSVEIEFDSPEKVKASEQTDGDQPMAGASEKI